jgi:hypothetical protein
MGVQRIEGIVLSYDVNLDVLSFRATRSPNQRADRLDDPSIAPDDLPDIVGGDRHREADHSTLFSALDRHRFRLIDKRRDQVLDKSGSICA